MVDEDIRNEFIGIVNYSLIAFDSIRERCCRTT